MAKRMDIAQQGNLDELLAYLDALRESGVTNMFGAGPYLVEEFGITSAEARRVLGHWMRTFGERPKASRFVWEPGDMELK